MVRVFLRLGLTGFGGPAAHVAMMNLAVVERRGWLLQQEFLDLRAIANVLPGPTSTELALLIGQHLKGWRGLVLVPVASFSRQSCWWGCSLRAMCTWGDRPG